MIKSNVENIIFIGEHIYDIDSYRHNITLFPTLVSLSSLSETDVSSQWKILALQSTVDRYAVETTML